MARICDLYYPGIASDRLPNPKGLIRKRGSTVGRHPTLATDAARKNPPAYRGQLAGY